MAANDSRCLNCGNPTPCGCTEPMPKAPDATVRYGNRRVTKMIADIDKLRRAIRSHDSEATEAAWDNVEQHIDYAYRAEPAARASTADMTARELLDLHDRSISGAPMTDIQKQAELFIVCAASFGAAACEASFDRDAAPISMMRAFLMALVDPLDERLDYLRRDPQPAIAYRAEVRA